MQVWLILVTVINFNGLILLLKYLLHLQISPVNPVGPYRIGTVKSSTEWLLTLSCAAQRHPFTCSSSEGEGMVHICAWDKELGHSLELSPVSVPSALEQGRRINCYPETVQKLRTVILLALKKIRGGTELVSHRATLMAGKAIALFPHSPGSICKAMMSFTSVNLI